MVSCLILGSAGASAIALARSTHQAPTTQPARSAAVLALSSESSAIPPTVPAAPQPGTATQCIRGTYSLPGAISLDKNDSGILLQIDSPRTYRVYGSSTNEIIAQISHCTPVRSGGVFAANTGYSLSNYYTYAPGSDGLCRVSGAAVGLHINQVFPTWTATAPTATARRWQTFITSLHTHEQGHVEIDKSYAAQVLDAMRATAPESCQTLQTTVDNRVKALNNALQQANNDYDAITNHGTAQGAVM